jgi:aspartyl-tRNA(Asn)/glutamyl-tRNA(Gln) amidotransferase subunit A
MMDGVNSRRDFLIAAGMGAAGWAHAESQDLAGLTLKKASDLLRSKTASPVDLTQACLKRIEKYNPALKAFITVTGEQALASAKAMEAEQQKGKWRGPLHGIPIALKDNMDTAGVRTTGASEVFKDRIPSEDAEVVRRLKNAGAIVLGKLNLHEFAFGGTSSVTYFGAVHNPWALDRVPGGSSGGSAAAVAADLCFGALGTDTAGSVRIPASYCGVVGLKPTYGRVSIRGVIPLFWSLDHVGPICKTVEDAASMLGAIAGYDAQDPTTVDTPVPDYSRAMKMPVSKLRLGIPQTPFFDSLDPDVAKAVNTALDVLRKLTAGAADIQLPATTYPVQVWSAESYAYHAKWIKESPNKYQPTTRRAIQSGADVKAADYADALRQVNLLRREIRKTFANVDLLITPTMPTPAPLIGATGANVNGDAVSIRNTSPFDVFGLPTISVPCGFSSSGLPIGLQISGAPFAESTVLALAQAYEQATDWHNRHPKLAI